MRAPPKDLPPPHRVGDRYDLDGGTWTLRGLEIDDQPPLDTGFRVNGLTEYGQLWADHMPPMACPTITLQAQAQVERGGDPLEDVEWRKASLEVRAAMKAALAPRPGEPPLSDELFRDARERGHVILVGGGAVRDALMGRPSERRDIDLTGTLLHVGFKTLVRRAEWFATDGHPERLETPAHFTPGRDTAVIKVTTGSPEPIWEYAPLKERWDRRLFVPLSSGYIYGSSFATDARWRDVTVNTLLFDPLDARVYAPIEDSWRDIGLDGTGRVRLSPVDPPDDMPSRSLVKRLARLVPQVLVYAPDEGQGEDVQRWCTAHADRLVAALLEHGGASPRDDHPLTAELRSGLGPAGIDRVRGAEEHLKRLFGSVLWPAVAPLLPPQVPINGPWGDEATQVRRECRAVARLIDVGGAFELDTVEGPDDTSRSSVLRYFGRRFARHTRSLVTVVLEDGSEVDAVSALAPPFGDGVWYAELGPGLGLIQSRSSPP